MIMKNVIKLFDPSIGKEEELAIKHVLKSKIWANGAGIGKVSEFENKFKKYTNSKNCVAVNSGTAALNIALSLINIKNKEVILPSLSFVSTANCILMNGGIPVFADVEPQTLCLEVDSIKKSITKKTKAIIPVHFGGMSCNMKEIIKTSKANNLMIVEDAAHATGASFQKKKIGSHGDFVCFSFHPVKIITTGEGGAMLTNNKDIASKFSALRSHGIVRDKLLNVDHLCDPRHMEKKHVLYITRK